MNFKSCFEKVSSCKRIIILSKKRPYFCSIDLTTKRSQKKTTFMKKPPIYTRKEFSWILYDVANSPFVLIMITTMMPVFYKEIAAGDMAAATSTATWGYANSLAALTVGLLSPLLGSFADYPKRKKMFFSFFFLLGIISLCFLLFSKPGAWLYVLVFFILGRIGWSGTDLFYNSFLIDVTSKSRMDTISTAGYAFGYIGSVPPFILFAALVLLYPSEAGYSISMKAAFLTIIIVALWWLLFTFPFFFKVKQRYSLPPSQRPLTDGFSRLYKTIKEIKGNKKLFMFLLAYFFYIDGVDTIISMSMAYGQDINLSTTVLIAVILFIQVLAFPFALLYGILAKKIGARRMIFVGIGVYAIITAVSFFLSEIDNPKNRELMFWLLAFLVATSMGGIQALSRSLFAANIPKEKSAEYFGFYNIFGKFSAVIGPAMLGFVGELFGHSRYGILSLFILFILGWFFLMKAGDLKAEGF